MSDPNIPDSDPRHVRQRQAVGRRLAQRAEEREILAKRLREEERHALGQPRWQSDDQPARSYPTRREQSWRMAPALEYPQLRRPQRRGTSPALLFTVAVITGALFVLGSYPIRPAPRYDLDDDDDFDDFDDFEASTSGQTYRPSQSSFYPDGPGFAGQDLRENISVLGDDSPVRPNTEAEWDRISKLPRTAELDAKSQSGRERALGTGSFATGTPLRPPSSGEGLGSGSPLSTEAGGGPSHTQTSDALQRAHQAGSSSTTGLGLTPGSSTDRSKIAET